ncbi:ABC transporter substrate-binding protein [Paenibacillus yanchengensis]|uniref:ABC transporter substrate-binding protein n=1 Tax=Paenibacillus yanchengensis TaxID=2035833 RepID=A0ABW4YQH6_9BACL
MKKRIGVVAVLMLMVMAAIATGCSKDQPNGTNGDSTSSNNASKPSPTEESASNDAESNVPVDQIKITMNLKPDDGAVQEYKDMISGKFATFNEKYAEYEATATFYNYSPETFIPRIEAKKVDTMTYMWATETKPLAARGLLKPLDSYLDQVPELKEALNMEIVGQISRGDDGQIYSIPLDGYTQLLLYNRERFADVGLDPEKPPTNWDELTDYAKKLTDPDANRFGLQINGADGEAAWKFQNYVFQAGGEMESLVDGKWQATFNSDAGVAALEFMKDLKWTHGVAHPNVLTNQDESMRLLATGEAAMVLGDGWVVHQAVNQYGAQPSNIGIGLLPAGPQGQVGWQMGGSIAAFPNYASDEEVIAGLKFLYEYYFNIDKETVENEYLARVKGREIVGVPKVQVFSTNSDAAQMIKEAEQKYAVLPQTNIKFDPYVELAPGLMPEPPQEAQLLYKRLSVAIQTILTDKNADPKSELDQAAAEVNAILEKNVN